MSRSTSRLIPALLVAALAAGALSALARAPEAKVLRHVVLFKFKDSVTADQIKEVEQAFSALPSKIDTIVDYEWGTDVSVEEKSKGFTHCFFVSFKDEAGRATYLPHPAHQKFVELVGPRLEDVLVVDYFTK